MDRATSIKENDFAARMDWCVLDYESANHNPIAVVNGDESRNVLYQPVEPGTRLSLDASQSSDPDGDDITFQWWIYPEAGTYVGKMRIFDAETHTVGIVIPSDLRDKEIHVMLTVRDTGKPPLTSYRRIVLRGLAK